MKGRTGEGMANQRAEGGGRRQTESLRGRSSGFTLQKRREVSRLLGGFSGPLI